MDKLMDETVDLAKQGDIPLETIGDELNKAVDNIRQVDKDG
jgi:hypothetical protein